VVGVVTRALYGAVAIFGGLLLAGCTASAPMAYRPPVMPYGWHTCPGDNCAPTPDYPLPSSAAPDQQPSAQPPMQHSWGRTPAPVTQPNPPPVINDSPVPLPVSDPLPLRPVDPDPPVPDFSRHVTVVPPPPVDATDCTGWWRICHLY
jgi:hypothetical protein